MTDNNYATKFLGRIITVKVDREVGSVHPKHAEIIYSINYGYVPGVSAPDGEELDAYILGVSKPVKKFVGKCITIIHRLDEDDDKLVVVGQNDIEYSDDEIIKAIFFQEQFHKSEIIRKPVS